MKNFCDICVYIEKTYSDDANWLKKQRSIIRSSWIADDTLGNSKCKRMYTMSISSLSTRKTILHSPFVRNVLDAMLNEVKSEMNCRPNDYLRLNIRHPSLDSDIWYESRRQRHTSKIKGVQQSKIDFTMTDGAIQFDFFLCTVSRKEAAEIRKNTCSSTMNISRRVKNPL